MKLSKNILIFIFFLCVGLIAYSNSFKNGFVLDDTVLIDARVKNLAFFIQNFDPHIDNFCYRPMVRAALSVCYFMFGPTALGYHVVNLILLCIAAFLLYRLMRVVFDDNRLAFFTGLLFLVHPLNVTLVNYISSANMILLVIFVLASLLAALVKRPVWAMVFFILALLCHESAMLLPLYAWSVLWAKERDLRKIDIRQVMLLLVVLAIYFIWRLSYASLNANIFGHFAEFHMNILEFTATLVKLKIWFLNKLIFPSGIVFTWGIPVVRANVVAWCLVCSVVTCLAAYVIYRMRKNLKFVLGLLWLCSGIVLIAFGCVSKPRWFLIVEPYWLEFALIGFCLCLASAARHWFLLVLCIGSWMILDRTYNDLWADEKTYCYYWLEQFPQYNTVHGYLAKIYDREGDFSMQALHNRLIFSDHPLDQLNYYTSEGVAALKQGRWQNSKAFLNKAYVINSHSGTVLMHLGLIAFHEGNANAAIDLLARALEEDPKNLLARLNLAVIVGSQGRLAQAIELYKENLRIAPHDELNLIGLIQIYIQQKDQKNSLRIAQEMLSYSDNPSVLRNVAAIFQQNHQEQKAKQALDKIKTR